MILAVSMLPFLNLKIRSWLCLCVKSCGNTNLLPPVQIREAINLKLLKNARTSYFSNLLSLLLDECVDGFSIIIYVATYMALVKLMWYTMKSNQRLV